MASGPLRRGPPLVYGDPCFYCGKPSVALELVLKRGRRIELPECEQHSAHWRRRELKGERQYRDRTGLSPCCEQPVRPVGLSGDPPHWPKYICTGCNTAWTSTL